MMILFFIGIIFILQRDTVVSSFSSSSYSLSSKITSLSIPLFKETHTIILKSHSKRLYSQYYYRHYHHHHHHHHHILYSYKDKKKNVSNVVHHHHDDDDTDDDSNKTNSNLYITTISTIILLSTCSGLSPVIQIISQIYKARLPDCPIAHDVDTLLLWPSSSSSSSSQEIIQQKVLTFSIFTKPMAAITSSGTVDMLPWKQIKTVFITHCFITSCICILGIVLLYIFLQPNGTQENEEKEEEVKTSTSVNHTL